MKKTQCFPLSFWLDKSCVDKDNMEITDGTYVYSYGKEFGIIYRYTGRWCVKPLGYFIFIDDEEFTYFKFLKISDYL